MKNGSVVPWIYETLRGIGVNVLTRNKDEIKNERTRCIIINRGWYSSHYFYNRHNKAVESYLCAIVCQTPLQT